MAASPRTTLASLDAITTKYERKAKTVEIVGLMEACAERHSRLTGELPSHRPDRRAESSTSAHGRDPRRQLRFPMARHTDSGCTAANYRAK